MGIRETIVEEMSRVAAEQGKKLAPLTDDLLLLESGLDSLCFAILVARLEASLNLDPFSFDTSTPFPVTLGDFIGLYEHATA